MRTRKLVEESGPVHLPFAKPRVPPTTTRLLLLLSLLASAVAIGAFVATRSINPLRGDSAEYLYFDPSRTFGYPAFLELVRALTGNVALAVPAQLALLAGSLVVLAWSFHRLIGRPVTTIVFQLLLIANFAMWFIAAFLMSEALATALVALWCAGVLRLIKDPRLGRFAGLIMIAGAAMIVRPSLVSLLIGSAVLILVLEPKRARARAAALTAAGLLLAYAATPLAQVLVHGSPHTSSPFARGILQHSLYCVPGVNPGTADARFVEASAEPVRRYISSAPREMQEQLRREYSTPLRFGLIIPVLGRRHEVETRSAVDPYLARIALERVRANPQCYLAAVANEYLRMLMFDTDPSLQDARMFNAYVALHPPPDLPQYPILGGDERLAHRAGSELERPPAGLNPVHYRLHVAGDVPLALLLPLRLLYAAGALLGALALAYLVIARRQPKDRLLVLGASAAAGAALHASLAITAIVEIGFYRYLVPCWPLVCTLVALLVSIVRTRSYPVASARRASHSATPAAIPIDE